MKVIASHIMRFECMHILYYHENIYMNFLIFDEE